MESSSSPLKIISPRQILPENARVSDLIDDDSRLWKSSLIDSIFLPSEAEQIKSIPLHPSRPDSMVWSGTPNGHFSTRNAYQLQTVHAQFAMMRMRQFFTLYGIVNMQELYGKIPYYTNSTIPYKYLTGMMSWRRFYGHNDSKILKHFLL